MYFARIAFNTILYPLCRLDDDGWSCVHKTCEFRMCNIHSRRTLIRTHYHHHLKHKQPRGQVRICREARGWMICFLFHFLWRAIRIIRRRTFDAIRFVCVFWCVYSCCGRLPNNTSLVQLHRWRRSWRWWWIELSRMQTAARGSLLNIICMVYIEKLYPPENVSIASRPMWK